MGFCGIWVIRACANFIRSGDTFQGKWLNGSWLLWSVYDGLLWRVKNGFLWYMGHTSKWQFHTEW